MDIVEPRNLMIVLSGLLGEGKTKASQVMFVRSWDIIRAHHSPMLLRTMQEAALVLPVSRAISGMARFLGHPRLHCYYPFQTIIKILTWLESMGGSLFLLGSGKQDIVSVEQNVRQTFPHIRFLGKYPGVFPKHMSESVAMAVHKANPHLLIAGSGLKGRDRWLHVRRNVLNSGIMIWSGEWFDFIIQKRRRPGKVAVRKGHEWIWELYSHPGKLFRVPVFLLFWLRLVLHRLFR